MFGIPHANILFFITFAEMKRSGKNSLTINDFFGTTRNYYVFAISAPGDLFSFAWKLQQYTHRPFSFLGTFSPDIPELDALFGMMYCRLSEIENIDLVVIENKTNNFNSTALYSSNKEKTLAFRTLSLFTEPYFIFNAQGHSLYRSKQADLDYLLFISMNQKIYDHVENPDETKKAKLEREVTEDQEAFSFIQQHIYKAKNTRFENMSHLIMKKGTDSKRSLFFKEMFWKTEVNISQFLQERDQRLLAKRRKLPDNNLKIKLPEDDVQKVIDIDPKYVELLGRDCSFE